MPTQTSPFKGRGCFLATFPTQGCQMIYVVADQISNLGIFWSALNWKILEFLMAKCYILSNLDYFLAI
jgi:hypothetical protein